MLNEISTQLNKAQDSSVIRYLTEFIEALENFQANNPKIQKVFHVDWIYGVGSRDSLTRKGRMGPRVSVSFTLGSMSLHMSSCGDDFFGIIRKGRRYKQRRYSVLKNEYHISPPKFGAHVIDLPKLIDILARIEAEHDTHCVYTYAHELNAWFQSTDPVYQGGNQK